MGNNFSLQENCEDLMYCTMHRMPRKVDKYVINSRNNMGNNANKSDHEVAVFVVCTRNDLLKKEIHKTSSITCEEYGK